MVSSKPRSPPEQDKDSLIPTGPSQSSPPLLSPLALGLIQPAGSHSILSSSAASSRIWNVQDSENLMSSPPCSPGDPRAGPVVPGDLRLHSPTLGVCVCVGGGVRGVRWLLITLRWTCASLGKAQSKLPVSRRVEQPKPRA